MKKETILKYYLSIILLFLVCLFAIPAGKVLAADASAISFGLIDYDNLTMQVYNNNNTVVYYSTDNSNWMEVEGSYNSLVGNFTLDISWVSSTSDVILYFKGDIIKTIKTITIPMKNTAFKVTYDKAEGEFTFDDYEDAETFQWRKSTDYTWNTVSLEDSSASYKSFVASMEEFRLKGTKIVIRTPQVLGTGINNVGRRQSKEITIAITARKAAPSVKVNSSKFTLNTSTAMEYYDTTTSLWIECSRTMSIDEIAPKVLYGNGANNTTLQIRTAATSSTPYSKTAYVTIPGQAAPPTLGGTTSDVTYYYVNSRLTLVFNNASSANVYEYAIVKPTQTYDVAKVSWRSVSSTKAITLSTAATLDGNTIYVRKKGIDVSSVKSLVLASAVNRFTVVK